MQQGIRDYSLRIWFFVLHACLTVCAQVPNWIRELPEQLSIPVQSLLDAPFALTRACPIVPDPTNSLTRISSAYSVQQTVNMLANAWFTVGSTTYLVVAGNALGGTTARLYRFNPDFINDPYPATFPLRQVTSGTNGFNTQPATTVRAVSIVQLGSETFLAVGGDVSGGISTRLYRFNIYAERFDNIPGAYSVQHSTTVRSMRWGTTAGGTTYLTLAGNNNAGTRCRIYRFNPSTFALTQLSGGTAGFDVQPNGTAMASDWVTVGADSFYVVGTNSVVAANAYRFSPYLEQMIQLTAGTAGFNTQPTATVNGFAWLTAGGTTYLAVGQNLTGGNSTFLYTLNQAIPELFRVAGAFDIQHPASIMTVAWTLINGTPYLSTGGALSSGVSMRLYALNTATNLLTSQTILTSQQHAAQVNAISTTSVNNVFYLAQADNTSLAVSSELYQFSQITNPYCGESDLVISKTASSITPSEGETVTFTVTLTNRGPATATGITVQDILSSRVTFVSSTATQGGYSNATGLWSVGTLVANQSATLTITVTINSGTVGQTIVNTATILSAYGITDPYTNNNSASVTLTVRRVADLTITKVVSDQNPVEGTNIVYTVSVRNNGPSAYPGVFVNDLLPAGVTFVSSSASQGIYNSITGVWNVGSLASGSTATLTITATVNYGTAGTIITNTASVNDVYGVDPYAGSNTARATIVPILPIADLFMTKSVSDSTPIEGQTIVFTLGVTNRGPSFANGVVISDTLPLGVTFVSSSASQGNYNSTTGLWTVGNLAANATATLSITATVNFGTGGSTLVNTACAIREYGARDPYVGNDCASVSVAVKRLADLSISKVVSDQNPTEGTNIIYTITVTNNGPSAYPGVFVNDLLPAGVTFVSSSVSQGIYNSITGVWNVGALASGSTATLTITATVNYGTAGTTITNTASVNDVYGIDPYAASNTASATIVPILPIADLFMTKSVSDSTPIEGQTIVFTLGVINRGPSFANGVVISDTLPLGVTFVSSSASQGSYSSSTGLWTVGNLAANASATLSITATVNFGTGGSTLVNTACAIREYGARDPYVGNDCASVSVAIKRLADLSISKVVSDQNPVEGTNIVYTVSVRNNGPSAYPGVFVNDLLPAGVTFVSSSASQGVYNSITGVWNIGALLSGSTATLTITATVNYGTAGTTITNTASVNDVYGIDPYAGSNTARATIVPVLPIADLFMTKSVSDSTPIEGQTIVFTLGVTNRGPSFANGVVISDTLPLGVTYVSSSASQGNYDSTTGLWTVGNLAANASATLSITATVNFGTGGSTLVNTACAIREYGAQDPYVGNDCASVSVAIKRLADLAITKTVSDQNPVEGTNIVYTVSVRNNGPSTYPGVFVNDLLPAGVTFVSSSASQGGYNSITGVWNVGALASGSTATLTITATVNYGTAGTTITNTASVNDVYGIDPYAASNTASATIVPILPIADLFMTKSVSDSAPIEGQTIVFTLGVTNRGPSFANGVVISDTLPLGVTFVSSSASQGSYDNATGVWTVGDLAANASATLSITATVNFGTGGSTLVNTACAIREYGAQDPYVGNDCASVSVAVKRLADLSISKVVSDQNPVEGTNIVYTVSVRNNGPSTYPGVFVNDLLPAGVTFVSSSASQGVYNSITGVWNVGALASGSTATLTITATVNYGTAGTTITNTASVNDVYGIDPYAASNTASATIVPILPIADLFMTKSVSDSTPIEGQSIVFTLGVTNRGPSFANGVVISDTLPLGVTFVSSSASQGSYDNATGVWTVGDLAANASATLSITATVNFGTGGSTFVNTACAIREYGARDPYVGNDCASVTVNVQRLADLTITKTVSDQNPTEGTNIIYTITVTNNGPSAYPGVFVNDLLPAGVTFVSSSASQGIYNSITGVWNVGALLSGSTATLTITATVNYGTAGTSITNTASVNDVYGIDPYAASNTASATIVPVLPIADLFMTKSVSDSTPIEGQTIVFTLGVTNRGPSFANGVVISDTLPLGVTFVSSSASQGSYSSSTGLWTVGNLAANASATLSITATVNFGTGGSTLVNTACAIREYGARDPYVGNDCASVSVAIKRLADLSISKVVSDQNPVEGTNIVYTVSVRNNGPSTYPGVFVNDLLPAGVTFVSSSASQGVYNSITGVWNVGALASGSTATLTITATVNYGTAGTTITNTASVNDVYGIDPYAASNTASATIVPILPIADLFMTKSVSDSTPIEGQTIVFTLGVTNRGPSFANGVVISDTLPNGVTFVSSSASQGNYNSTTGLWTVGNLAANASATLSITATVNFGTGGSTLVNTACAIREYGAQDPYVGNDCASVTVNVQRLADLSISKVVSDQNPTEGTNIIYTITVTNNGPSAYPGLFVNDLLPAGVTFVSSSASQGVYNSITGVWNIGALLSGSTATLTITATVNYGTAGTTITNMASVNDVYGIDPYAASNTASATIVPVLPIADLAMTKSVSDSTPIEGQTIVFTLGVTNRGPSFANGVVISDTLPLGVTFVSSSASQGSYDNATGVWTVGYLAANATATLSITATVNFGTGGSTLVNTACAIREYGAQDPYVGNDCASVTVNVQRLADLSISKVVSDQNPVEGTNIVYTVSVRNNGPSAYPGLFVNDLLPAGVTFVSSSASQGVYNSITGVWNVGALASGSTATLTITATVNYGTAGTTITNTASVNDVYGIDPYAASNTASATIVPILPIADLFMTKSVSDSTPIEGQTIVFTLGVTNRGPSFANGVVISDTLPLGVTFVSSSASQGSYDNSTGLWTVGDLAANASATLSITATVNFGTGGSTLVNTACTIGEYGAQDPYIGNDCASVTVNVQRLADLSISKVVSDQNPTEGTNIIYTITVTNNGPSAYPGVFVNDLLPAGVTFVSSSASQGFYNSITGVWNVGALTSGSTATLTISATVNYGTAGTTITNTASVNDVYGIDPYAASNTASATIVPILPIADLFMTKSVSDSTPIEGQTIVFTLGVINRGPSFANGVVISDTLPSGVTFVSSSASQGSYDNSTGIWTVGDLAANASATLSITTTVNFGTGGSTLVNTACAIREYGAQDPYIGNDCASVSVAIKRLADLSISKVVSDQNPVEGTNIVYTVVVTNNGISAYPGVFVNDLLPAGVTYVSSTTTQGVYNSITGEWNVGSLGSGASATLTITATVNYGTAGTTITNTASVNDVYGIDPYAASNTASATIVPILPIADLFMTKSVSDSTPIEGQTIVFTLGITNRGPSFANGVVISDTLPSGVTFVSSNASQGNYNSTTSLWTVGDLAANASATLSITATVNFGTGGSTLVNTACAIREYGAQDPYVANDCASVTVNVQRLADLSISKVVSDQNPTEGTNIIYTITVTNNGPSAYPGVFVNDLLPAGVTFVSSSASQGIYNSITGVWSVGSLASGSTATLTITATVNYGTAGTTITNTASVNDVYGIDPYAASNTASATIVVQPDVDFVLTKSVNNQNPREGDTVVYTIIVTCKDEPQAAVSVFDPLPTGVTYLSSSATRGSYNPLLGLWSIGDMTHNETEELQIVVHINSGTGGKTIINTAQVLAPYNDDPYENVAASVALTVQSYIREHSLLYYVVVAPFTSGGIIVG